MGGSVSGALARNWDEEAFSPASISWRMRPPGKPFFGMYAFMETHESALFPRRGWPRSIVHLVMGIFQTWLHWEGKEVVKPGAVDVPPYYPDTPEVRNDIARHYNNIYTMDLRVGELLAELERDGLADDTIAIWSTDHGDGLPRAKREIFDSGIRVPMIIRWPDRFRPIDAEPGRLDHRLISFVDLAPQIIELAGVAAPDVMDGRPFLDTPPRKYVFAAKDRMDEVSDRQRAARDDRYKYIRNYAPGSVAAQPLDFRENLPIMRSLWTALKEGRLDASITPFGDELRITCTSESASIGYRINDDDKWQLYTDPIDITKSLTRIDAKAVRYGWTESDSIRVDFQPSHPRRRTA